jgi:hypothetical protein
MDEAGFQSGIGNMERHAADDEEEAVVVQNILERGWDG